MARSGFSDSVVNSLEKVGRGTARRFDEIGVCASLVFESMFWLFVGPGLKQPVRLSAVFQQMMEYGVRAIPIIGVLSAAIGAVLAMQGIIGFKKFGAESQVTFGVAVSMVREFAPLITGILIAGRSGSALAARIGTMQINQEIDALEVMGIRPVRFLVAPALLAMFVMVPVLTIFSGFIGLLAAGIYIQFDLAISLDAYFGQVLASIDIDDVLHGFGKSVAFGVLIAVIGVMNGANVSGGAEGVGKATTRSVVQAIFAIVMMDLVFVTFSALTS
ncbi:MAG: ABC transporter permease [Rhodospirillales bacterium]|nr:ABC transporter permease [Rhodospirillales bacterium]